MLHESHIDQDAVVVLPADGAPAYADLTSDPSSRRTSSMSIDELLTQVPTTHSGIGIIAPFDFALDRELWRWTPDNVSVHVTRTPYVAGNVSVEFARNISGHQMLQNAARDLSIVQPSSVAYACTSGSFVEGIAGEKRIRQALAYNGMDVAVTASGALIAAAHAMGLTNLAIVAPYVSEVSRKLCDFVEEAGLSPVNMNTMELGSGIWKVSYAEVVKMVLDTDVLEADAVFISCTNVPTYDVIAPLEKHLGKPVMSANQVLMWAALRAADLHVADGIDSQLLINQTTFDAA